MAVIGSGPAGFYTAYKVMANIENAIVDMYEQLPVPYGLVRFGVAPDHPEVKKCEEKFAEVASSSRFNFLGNVDVGKDLSLSLMKNHYNALLFAYGASKDRLLGIPSEDTLKGIYSARAFVGWYNGLPEHARLSPDLEAGEEAIIIGQGNVALDVARTLLTDVDHLRKTDMTDHALSALSKSRVRRVRVVGRRGPMQASFTIKEVRELMKLPLVGFGPIKSDLLPPNISELPRTAKRLMQLLSQGASLLPGDAPRSWSLDFLLSPKSFNNNEVMPHNLSSITFVKNLLEGMDPLNSSAKAISTEEYEVLPASLAFRSIGYKSEPLPGMKELGMHFDVDRGIISNDLNGRATAQSSSNSKTLSVIPGIYCSGWVKRGPAGVIANTMEDAFATAAAITSDWERKAPFLNGVQGWDLLKKEAMSSGQKTVSWNDWMKIDAAEKQRGKMKGKEREKFTSTQQMLQVLD
ncbi:NADPH-adrenodoxin reductase [Pseudocyphellaria aurata]|nr:NADPH-adrenodoxin reductase [Pseudocyphellaria aurata]